MEGKHLGSCESNGRHSKSTPRTGTMNASIVPVSWRTIVVNCCFCKKVLDLTPTAGEQAFISERGCLTGETFDSGD